MKYRLKNGIHEIILKSLTDPGGYSVFGFTDVYTTDYYQSVGLAGNGFTNNYQSKYGNWNGTLLWGKNDQISFLIDCDQAEMKVTNLTNNNNCTWKIDDKNLFKDKEF